MEEFLSIVAAPFLSAVVSAVVALVFNRIIRRSVDGIDGQKAMYEGVKTLLRNELVDAHREYVQERGEISLEALEYVEDTYRCYHAMKGNGSGTKLWEDIKALPIKD